MKWLAVLAVVGSLGVAHAETPADAQFKKGKELLAKKKYAEACAAFEKSNALQAEIGTKLNIGKCYEEWGKLATALKWYRDAEKQAADSKDNRLAKIKEHAQAVDDDTPRLTLKAPKDADMDAANVLLDGAKPKAFGEAFEIDPGQHVVEFTTEGGDRKKKVVPVERGGTSEVKLDLPKQKPKQAKDPAPPVEEPHVVTGKKKVKHVADPGQHARIASYVIGGVGVAAMLSAGYLTIDAHADYQKALDDHCMGMTNACDAAGLSTTHHARSQANVATIVGVGGLLAAGGAVTLYILTPKPKVTYTYEADPSAGAFYWSPVVNGDGGGVVFGGRF